MKLYHNGQSEGWQLPGQQDKAAERADVPSSPAELADWLNARRVTPAPSSLVTVGALEEELEEELEQAPCNTPPIGDRNRCPACKSRLIVTAAGADAAAIGRDIDKVADWAMEAPDWALTRLSEIFAERGRELLELGNKGKAN